MVFSIHSTSGMPICSSNADNHSLARRYGSLLVYVIKMILKIIKVLSFLYPIGPTISTEQERIAMCGQCKWVDEVLPHAPWVITECMLKRYHRIFNQNEYRLCMP